jgi:hypothetical protein
VSEAGWATDWATRREPSSPVPILRPMGRNAVRYSDDQRDAIVAAVLDQGFSAREAIVKAAAGELEPPAFEMPVSTAQAIVTDAKHRGRTADNTDRFHQLVDKALTVGEARMDKLLERAKTGQLNSQDATLARRLIQMAGHAAHLNNTLARGAPEPEPTPDSSARILERMMQDLHPQPAAHSEDEGEGPTEREQLRQELTTTANGSTD